MVAFLLAVRSGGRSTLPVNPGVIHAGLPKGHRSSRHISTAKTRVSAKKFMSA
jgi:hypothetical protein